jgi:hypothetical protein
VRDIGASIELIYIEKVTYTNEKFEFFRLHCTPYGEDIRNMRPLDLLIP